MDILLSKIVKTLFLPPGLIILLLLAGYFLARRFQTLGKVLLFGGFSLLVALSLPVVAQFNMQLLESDPPLGHPLSSPRDTAIVILGGGRNFAAPEYSAQDTVNGATLERLRYGAWLFRNTHNPILVTGGKVFNIRQAEASLMRNSLVNDFGVPVKWLETRSHNTWENAVFSGRILQAAGIKRIYLVTHAAHMRRARMAFRNTGLQIIPAPMGFTNLTGETPLLIDLLPDYKALDASSRCLHEWLGMLWYRIRYPV